MPIYVAIPLIIVVAIITALIVWNVAISYRKKVVETKIGTAEEKAREIIDEAMKTAEAKKREGLLELKEEALKNKNELERENRERRNELQ
ncbi:MAG: Rnase Y domain-containing protein, partial [Catenibacillus sp.]